MRLLALAGLALVVGCGEPLPVQIHTGYASPGAEEDEALVDEAMELLGVPWKLVDYERGAVHIALTDGEDAFFYATTRCTMHVTAIRSARSIAHEVGHALWLPHTCRSPDDPLEDDEELRECGVDDLDFLMNGWAGEGAGVELTEDERDQLDRGRRKIAGCR